MTPKQISFARGLLAKLGATEEKATLALSFSNGRTESFTDLNYEESVQLINHLKKQVGSEQTPKDRMTNKILSLAHEMRWELAGGKVDMDRINNWCTKYGHLHKPLNGYTEQELPKLVTQFEKIYKDFLSG